MTLEVRQLLLKAMADDDSGGRGDRAQRGGSGCCEDEHSDAQADAEREALKEEILAACKRWLREERGRLYDR
jgi:hypothetical protein